MSRPPVAWPRNRPEVWTSFLSRRDALRVGGLGIASALLPGVARSGTLGKTAIRGHEARAKSVIFLWMAGGVTHIDSFDPKPDGPAEIRGTLRPIATALPGVRFSEVMPNLARQAHQLALIRSYSHDSDDHFLSQAYALSGRKVTQNQVTTEPNIGSIIYRLHGPRAGFPGSIAIPGTTRPGPPPTNEFTAGWLGREYDPFFTGGAPRNDDFTQKVLEPAEDEFLQQALKLAQGLDRRRLAERRSLRQRLETGLRQIEQAGLSDAVYRQYATAFEMLQSPSVRRAFELQQEPDAVRERYGKTKIGQRCLLARRLVEAGARFVMVDYGYDPEYGNLWDNHCVPIQKQPHICEMAKRPYHLAGMDRAFAALLADLR